ncbi:MAG: uncultured phage MedDCM-OCT-S37-C6 [Cyanobacteriota bacterium]|jgi:DNA-binding MarR family transcriptional regulator
MDLDQLARALDVFKTLDPAQLPAHRIRMFLEIAKCAPVEYKELETRLITSNASVSRGIQALSDGKDNGQPGLGLVESYPDPADNRRFLVRLTTKGKHLINQLRAL